MKKLITISCAVALLGWIGFRGYAISSENARNVFNVARVSAEHGMPIEDLAVNKQAGILKEPLAVKNNRAYVSASRIGKFKAGQKVGDGVIASVSNSIDMDSGMYVVRTRGVVDGTHFAELNRNGFFVPVHAVADGYVFVVQDGIAVKRKVTVTDQDSENALISSGIENGDVVILSQIEEGRKVK